MVTPTDAGIGGLGLVIIDLAAYFYSDNGLVALTQPESLKRMFDILIGLLGQVGLWTNTGETVAMVCQICHTPGRMSEEAYERRTTGIETTFW